MIVPLSTNTLGEKVSLLPNSISKNFAKIMLCMGDMVTVEIFKMSQLSYQLKSPQNGVTLIYFCYEKLIDS